MTRNFTFVKTALAIASSVLLTYTATAQWASKAAIPTSGRDASATFTINNKIYLAGGSGNEDFWRYDPVANTWTQLANTPGTIANRGFAVAFALNGKGYIATGADTSILTVKNDLWEYDTSTNTWAQKASMPCEGRDGAFSFVINNIAYVGGGNDSTGYLLDDFWAYNPVADSWSAKAVLPDYTIFPFAFSVGSYGYISCGQQGASETTATYRYDPVTNTWTAKAAFPGSARQAGTAFVLDSTAYCGLGMTEYTSAFQDFYTYNASTDTWTLLGNFPAGTDAWPVAATANNKAYVGTGWNFGSSFFSYWYQYTPPVHPAAAISPANDNGKVKIFPNPASGLLHIEIEGVASTNDYIYQLTNISGQLVMTGKLTPSIDVTRLPAGAYLLKIYGDGESIVTMITVQ